MVSHLVLQEILQDPGVDAWNYSTELYIDMVLFLYLQTFCDD
jgi:hypothetical protein